jgi:hypothetical protein
MSNKWWLCKAGQQLREQLDDSYPDRDRRSDGFLGDVRHSHLKSDHNPDPTAKHVVRACDFDRDLSGASKPDLMPYLADQIRLCAKSGDLRIKYIIFDGRIASSKRRWAWRKYTGSNSHKSHLHISFTSKGDFDGSFFNIPMIGGE